ncbi:MAG: M28 family peptidase, partial [Pirellulaceae bacterium]
MMRRLAIAPVIARCAFCLVSLCVSGGWTADQATPRSHNKTSPVCFHQGNVGSRDHVSLGAEKRVGSDIRYLASDELEGRGPGTKGLDKAARYIRETFENLGLRGAGNDGAYLRPFSLSLGADVIEPETCLVFEGPDDQELKLELKEQFRPLGTKNTDPMTLDVVFAGYGISAPKLGYDDYQNVDVEGKGVIIVRREPQQGDEESVFDGKRTTSHSYIRKKTQAARRAGASAVLLVNDPFTTRRQDADRLNRPGGFGSTSETFPFMHIKQSVFDRILQSTPVKREDKELDSLAEITSEIDENLSPLSRPLPGWKVKLQCGFETTETEVSNVAAVIDGKGPLAQETIVIGAHYDHVGYGSGNGRQVYNGADDNASGTAAVLELARRYATRSSPPRRRLLFIAFTAEERGLLGSNFYVNDPLVPLANTVAMLNFDMIGHLEDGPLTLLGIQSANSFSKMIDRLGENKTFAVESRRVRGGSDHMGFQRNRVPYLFFHTGVTPTYHTPDDDFHTLDIAGTVAVIDFAEEVLDGLLKMPTRPEFTEMKAASEPRRAEAYLGIVPDHSGEDHGG